MDGEAGAPDDGEGASDMACEAPPAPAALDSQQPADFESAMQRIRQWEAYCAPLAASGPAGKVAKTKGNRPAPYAAVDEATATKTAAEALAVAEQARTAAGTDANSG